MFLQITDSSIIYIFIICGKNSLKWKKERTSSSVYTEIPPEAPDRGLKDNVTETSGRMGAWWLGLLTHSMNALDLPLSWFFLCWRNFPLGAWSSFQSIGMKLRGTKD